jgi:hypothetical protein
VAHHNDTINQLHAAVRNARQLAPAAAALPTIEASAAYTLPDAADGEIEHYRFVVRDLTVLEQPG